MGIHEFSLIRATVLNDLKEFIPQDSYKQAKTEIAKNLVDCDLAHVLQLKQADNPQLFSPQQLDAIVLLRNLGTAGILDSIKESKIEIDPGIEVNSIHLPFLDFAI